MRGPDRAYSWQQGSTAAAVALAITQTSVYCFAIFTTAASGCGRAVRQFEGPGPLRDRERMSQETPADENGPVKDQPVRTVPLARGLSTTCRLGTADRRLRRVVARSIHPRRGFQHVCSWAVGGLAVRPADRRRSHAHEVRCGCGARRRDPVCRGARRSRATLSSATRTDRGDDWHSASDRAVASAAHVVFSRNPVDLSDHRRRSASGACPPTALRHPRWRFVSGQLQCAVPILPDAPWQKADWRLPVANFSAQRWTNEVATNA